MRLRERGIYCLPNGRELVVIGNTSTGNIEMCSPQGFQRGHYELDSRGRLLNCGKPTAWDINQLTDTGRTASGLSYMFEAEPDSEELQDASIVHPECTECRECATSGHAAGLSYTGR